MTRLLIAPRQRFKTRYVQSAVNFWRGYDVAWRINVPFLWLSPACFGGWQGAFVRRQRGQGVANPSAEEICLRDVRAPHACCASRQRRGVALHSFEDATDHAAASACWDSPPEQLSV